MTPTNSCRDIRSYLWETKHDLTLHPITISILATIYIFIVIVGCTGNLLVVMSVVRFKALQSVRNMFIVSLSVSDLFVAIFSGSVTPISAFSKVWLFGAPLCRFLPLLQGTALSFSTLTLTAIAIDRYILICHPTSEPIRKNLAFKMIIFNNAIAIALSAPLFLKQELVKYSNFCGEFCTENWREDAHLRSIYGSMVFIIQFVFPLAIITFCYASISFKLRNGVFTVTFALSWLPAVGFNFLRDYSALPGFIADQDYLFGIISHCISMASTIVNPFLYGYCNEHFRAAFVTLWDSVKTACGMRRVSPGNNPACSQLLSTHFESTTRRSITTVPSSI
ncbi:Protein CBR-NPR-10 [Caenorhabditis briggsae]|uniref:Protein CBR-NPR-10 n=1 Tax=Caenorhabditis briggsae TaxID=6238 RepID=A8XQ16_CAEBR|nr:Protein CBR-NPR-10 [Caenorhabditis briggsae]CAP34742.2 Protein CBR-NPR-10 [Caenorhabditis briggsae]